MSLNSINTVIFFGSNYKIAQIIKQRLPLGQIFCEKRSFNINLFNFAKLNDIKVTFIERLDDIEFTHDLTQSLGVSCGFGIIFKKQQVEKFEYGIWNIHYGKLPEFRGRHPISWGFLKNCQKLGLTIHQINEEIDRGRILAEEFVWRDLNDTQKEIEEKMEVLLETKLLNSAINNYFSGSTTTVGEGVYYESLAGKFGDINPKEYSSQELFNLFKSQEVYGGLRLRGKLYRECVFYNEEYLKKYQGFHIVVTKDGEKMGVR